MICLHLLTTDDKGIRKVVASLVIKTMKLWKIERVYLYPFLIIHSIDSGRNCVLSGENWSINFDVSISVSHLDKPND